MLVKILLITFLIIPLIVSVIAFSIGVTYLQVKEKTRCERTSSPLRS